MSPTTPDPARALAPPTETELRAAFDGPMPLTLGIEEELVLLDPETLDLAPLGPRMVELLDDEATFKLELPAAQLEIVTPPAPDVPTAMRDLSDGRARLLAAAEGITRPAAAAVHPFSATEGELNDHPRYRRTVREYGRVAYRQLVCALQVHVAIGDADRALAVYNGLRSHLPDLAALAASSPFYDGEDSGFASIRPKVAEELPRQSLPPAIESWGTFARDLEWGARSGTVPEAAVWWWELRPHTTWGTLELRVPDVQATVADAAAVAAVAHSLVAWLAERHEAGEELPNDPTWRIAENRWSACRWGVEGEMADLQTGESRPTRERLQELIDSLSPVAARMGCAAELEAARGLVHENGAMRIRAVAADGGVRAVAGWLADRFAE